ncbi:MAG: flagellar biosynthetic protein FliR [Ruegeria sp.]
MTVLTPEAIQAMENAIWHFALVFLRVGALVSILPAFGERTLPARIRLMSALAFAAIVAPAAPVPAPPGDVLQFAGFSLAEIAIGLVLGFGLRLFVLVLHTAGTIAAQSTSLSQILGVATADPAPAIGHLLIVGGLALAVMAGLHVRAAEFLILSYTIFPAGLRPLAPELAIWGTARIAESFGLAFLLASPFVIASFVYNLALGVINRAMPQLMVAFVGAPAITWGGLVLLLISAPIILNVWLGNLISFLSTGGGFLK